MVAAPLAQTISFPRVMEGAKIWFSRYPSRRFTLWVSSKTFFASSTFLPKGFSHVTPSSSPFPDEIALAISSNVSNSDTTSTQQGYGTMGRNLSFREMAVN